MPSISQPDTCEDKDKKVARFLYGALLTLLFPVVMLVFVLLGRKNPAWRQRLSERLGRVPHVVPAGGLWLHAASVGEVQASAPLVKAWQKKHPDVPVIVTTFTPTGSVQVRRAFGESVYHMYVPLDYPWMLKRFLKRLKPSSLVLLERELWPNMLAVAQQQNLPVLLANARLSEKSKLGYQKYPWLINPMIQALTKVAVHNAVDGERYLELGLPEERLEVVGSVKFDISVPTSLAADGLALRQQWGQQRTVLALASSHEDEDERLLDIYPQLAQSCPGLLLLLVPRHPERFGVVVNAAHARQLRVHRRSHGAANENIQVYVADTMGEMLKMLSAADLVLMGGSLIERGGHNPIEPAALGKATVIGPHYFNFAEIVDGLVAAQAMQLVSANKEQLAEQLSSLLNHPEQRQALGQAALQVVEQNRGAVQALVKICEELLVHNKNTVGATCGRQRESKALPYNKPLTSAKKNIKKN